MNTHLRALIVDAIGDARIPLVRILGQHRFECVLVRDGVEALQSASEYGIDLIVTGINLPRLGGPELVRLAQRGVFGWNPPPIIAYSDNPAADLERHPELELFCVALLRKPIEAAAFMTALSSAFGEPPRLTRFENQ
jgi:CheY-like chemotaxis protein